MRLLGIETALDTISVALLDDEKNPLPYSMAERAVFSENLMRLILKLLDEHQLTLGDIEGLAVSIGPGSFTGLRIGLSVAKGISLARNIPLVDVSTLDAIANSVVHSGSLDTGNDFFVVTDAKRDEYYLARYCGDGGKALRRNDAEVLEVSRLAERVAEVPSVQLFTPQPERLQEQLRHNGSKRIRFLALSEDVPPVSVVCLLGREKLQGGRAADVASIEPFYLKNFLFHTKN
jgi:tRNA threonylcarbamoyladenosine biosynthesis protein TsaB